MKELFDTPKVVHRRKNGQFATKEVAYADRVAEENKILRNESEKYRRMYLATLKENQKLKQRLTQIKSILL
jgi:hypothetical protein